MSEYIIKTVRKEEGKYNNTVYDEKGNIVNEDTYLENGETVKDILFYHDIGIVPFMRKTGIKSLETKMEITGK